MKAFLKNQKSHEYVVQLSFKASELKQLYWEDEKEFRFKGEMYDVIEKRTEGSLVIIRCIADKKETALLNEYQKQHKGNSSQSTIVQLITTQFVLPADCCLKPTETQVENYYRVYSSLLQQHSLTVLLPPPDVC